LEELGEPLEDSEKIKEWLRFLESRLNHYSAYYNFSLSTLLVILGLIAGAVSFTFYHLWATLIAMVVVVIGAVVLVRKGNVVLARLAKKKDRTMMLMVRVLDGSIEDSKAIAEEWMTIFRS
jgi:hypothetical protein